MWTQKWTAMSTWWQTHPWTSMRQIMDFLELPNVARQNYALKDIPLAAHELANFSSESRNSTRWNCLVIAPPSDLVVASAILVCTSAILLYCREPNRLRNCGLKKVAELRLRTFARRPSLQNPLGLPPMRRRLIQWLFCLDGTKNWWRHFSYRANITFAH